MTNELKQTKNDRIDVIAQMMMMTTTTMMINEKNKKDEDEGDDIFGLAELQSHNLHIVIVEGLSQWMLVSRFISRFSWDISKRLLLQIWIKNSSR